MGSSFYSLGFLDPDWMEKPQWDVDDGYGAHNAVRNALGTQAGLCEVYGSVRQWDGSTLVRCRNRGPVVDWVLCTSSMPFVSSRVKEFLEEHASGQLQFLPVYMGWRGRVFIEDPYFVAVPQVLVDCIDQETSEAKPNPRYRDFLEIYYKKLTIDRSRVPENISVFRMTHMPDRMVVRATLWNRLKKAKFTGVYPEAVKSHGLRDAAAISIAAAPEFRAGPPPAPEKLGVRSKDLMGLIKYLVKAGEVRVGEGASAKEVKALEKSLGFELPGDYRAIVSEFGGLDGYGIEVCGVERGNRGSALNRTAELREYPEIEWPERMVCFADDGRGGGYVLAERDRAWGVYYWDHEEQGEKRAAKLKKLSGVFEKWLYGVLVKRRLPY